MKPTWIRFEVGGRSYALPLDSVAEVTRAGRPRMIPGVRLEVGGILNVRGEPLPVVDGGVLLGQKPEAHSHALLLEQGGLRIALLVGRVSRIERELPPPSAEDDPDGASCAFVKWVGGGDRALGLVDPDGLLEHATALLTEARVHQEGEDQCPSAF